MSTDVVGVRFQKGATKIYSYRAGQLLGQLKLGDHVVVETKDGQDIGKIVMMGPLRTGKKRESGLKQVVRRATPRDLVSRMWYRRREGEALVFARKRIVEQQLPFKAIKAEFTYDGGSMTLHLLPHDEKQEDLDCDALCDEVARQYKTRVHARKLGPREASQLQEGGGLCGGEKCCTLAGIGQVSIDMVKQQNIAMNQPDAIGLCGRLRCSLRFEAPVYKEARANMPKIGTVVTTPQGKGEIVALEVLAEVLTIAVGPPDERVIIKMLLDELEKSDPDACPRCGKKGNKDKDDKEEA